MLFPNKRESRNFNNESTFLRFLKEGCNAHLEFLARLENVGYTSAATIVNRFSAAEKSIANKFAFMGSYYIFDDAYMETNLQLIVFVCTQILKETSS